MKRAVSKFLSLGGSSKKGVVKQEFSSRSTDSSDGDAIDTSIHAEVSAALTFVQPSIVQESIVQEQASIFTAIQTPKLSAAAYTPRIAPPSLTLPPIIRVDPLSPRNAKSDDSSRPKLGQVGKWNGVFSTSLTILKAEGVQITTNRKKGFRGMGLHEDDNPTKTALTKMRMFSVGEADPLNSDICCLDVDSLPFHVVLVLSLANGDAFRQSTYDAFKKLDESWKKMKSDLSDTYDDTALKLVMSNALGKHAGTAFDFYMRLAFICNNPGMQDRKLESFMGWVAVIEGLVHSTFQEMYSHAYLKRLETIALNPLKFDRQTETTTTAVADSLDVVE